MPKDYYLILGVSRGADLNQIKRAYRKIAKACHPDVSHEVNDRQFREIQEAYETLTDTDKRRAHDHELDVRSPAHRRAPIARPPRRGDVFFSDIDRFGSFVDEFFEGFVPGIFTKERYRSPQKDLYYQVFLTLDEARRGGLFPIKLPVLEPCSLCGSIGRHGDLYCPLCNGYGRIESQREFSISIPPKTVHGTRVSLSMEDIGLAGVLLHLEIYVDAYEGD